MPRTTSTHAQNGAVLSGIGVVGCNVEDSDHANGGLVDGAWIVPTGSHQMLRPGLAGGRITRRAQ